LNAVAHQFLERIMRRDAIAVFAGIFLMTSMLFSNPANAQTNATASETIVRMERSALDRWIHGDPDGFLEISDPEVVYFDPFLPQRLNGLDSLRRYYDALRGKVHLDRYELIDPQVQVDGNMAVLTFNFVSTGSEGEMRWNTTEVYRCHHGTWRIIQTHWSLTQPKLALPAK
jgi:hypothetical protein